MDVTARRREVPQQTHDGVPVDQEASWNYLSHVVIRRTGFPFEWLERLNTPDSAAQALEIATKQDEINKYVEVLLRQVFPAAVAVARRAGNQGHLRALSYFRRKVGRRLLSEADFERTSMDLPISVLNDLVTLCGHRQELAAMVTVAEAALVKEVSQCESAIRDIAGDPFFQEAVFLSNPELYSSKLLPLLMDSSREIDSKFSRKLGTYIQRFCAKNDTASFFGPLNCGRIALAQSAPLLIGTRGEKYTRREVFISYWIVSRLAEVISSEIKVQQWLRPRLHPLCRWEGATVYFPVRNRRARVNMTQQKILALVDGNRDVATISTAVGGSSAMAYDEISRLVEAKALICRLEVPSTIFHPFYNLLDQIENLPDSWERRSYWLQQLRQLDELRTEFVGSDLVGRRRILSRIDSLFTALTASSPRRSAGQMYADRMPMYEDCAGTLEKFQFGAVFFDDFQRRLQPILDLCAAHGTLLQAHYQAVGQALFREISPEGSAIPYGRFIGESQRFQKAGRFPDSNERLASLYRGLSSLVMKHNEGHIAQLSASELSLLLANVPIAQNCHASPDILLAAPDLDHLSRGEYQLVLGEMHQVIYAWGSQLYFHPQREDAEAEMAAHIGRMPDYAGLSTVLNERQHKGLLHESFPGTWIEVYAQPSSSARLRVPIAALEVVIIDGEVALRDGRNGQRLRIYTAGDEQIHLWSFSLPRVSPIPIDFGMHTPRIEINGVIYQRERWRLTVSEWGENPWQLEKLEMLVRTQRIVKRLEIPQHVYMHVASEQKPYFIDFSSDLSVSLLQQQLLRNEEVAFTEMLPRPEQFWLADQAGHYCCEFRMTACRY